MSTRAHHLKFRYSAQHSVSISEHPSLKKIIFKHILGLHTGRTVPQGVLPGAILFNHNVGVDLPVIEKCHYVLLTDLIFINCH